MKVLIADDHAIVREGIKKIVTGLYATSHIDEAEDGHEAFNKIKATNYQIIILDISMPGISGLELLQKIRNISIECMVLMLSFHPEEQYAQRAFKLGASGYISKNSSFLELQMAIKKIAEGGHYVSAELADNILFNSNGSIDKMPHELLSEREFQVLLLIAQGNAINQVAQQLSLSPNTIGTYRSRIMQKTGLNSNYDLTIYAIRNRLIQTHQSTAK